MNKLFKDVNVDDYFNKIKNNQHFKYSRFNDGELIAVIGDTPNKSNCDGHQYFPTMGIELRNVLLNYNKTDDYILESYDYWYNVLPRINIILNKLYSINNDLEFLSYDFIRITHEQNPEKFKELLDILKTKKIVIVGPTYLNDLDKYFNFKLIPVPVVNCYLDKNRIINDIIEYNKVSNDNIYLFSASMATNIIIDYFKDDKNNSYIDWGSVWDTFFVSQKYDFIRKRSTSNVDKVINEYKEYHI